MIKKIVLQKGKEKSVQRFHPWIFSGAILKKEGDIKDGDIVEVYDAFNNFLAMGHYHNSSICVRIFSFHPVVPDYNFWKTKVEKAILYRKAICIFDDPHTNMFRLINGEGDGMPGLIADWFNGNMIIQFHSIGMYLIKDMLVEIFQELFAGKLQSIYNKSTTTLPENKHIQPNDELLYGNFGEVIVKENDIPFYIDIVKGQKTGFFIDQRDNRKMVGEFAKGKKVLNLFCYTGGFSA
ncbi:MAG: class I SAM-dependent methyltransferase, partial [Bacteroidales bacterium]